MLSVSNGIKPRSFGLTLDHGGFTSRLGMAGVWLLSVSVALAQPGPASVVTAKVEEREVARGKSFVGTVKPLRSSTVGSAVEGRVIDFPIDEGDPVNKGQTLAQLKTDTISSQLAAAKAELKLRQEELREMENGSRPEEIDRAKAAMSANEARMEYTAKEFNRIRRLFEQGSASDDELDAALADSDEARHRYFEAKAAHDLVVAGTRDERIAQGKARVAAAEQEVELREEMLGKHTIIAPFNGYVVSEGTEVGEWVTSGQAVADVAELDVVEVRVLVVEDDVTQLRLGAEVRVEIPSLPVEAFTGVVSKIVPSADERSRSFPVHVRIENTLENGQPVIKAGMVARVMLPIGERATVKMAPKDAIVLGGPAPVVYVVEGEGANPGLRTVRPVIVGLGITDGGWIAINGDVQVGQDVVVEGNERLFPGQPVLVAPVEGGPTAKRELTHSSSSP